jgi:hypothetical protein
MVVEVEEIVVKDVEVVVAAVVVVVAEVVEVVVVVFVVVEVVVVVRQYDILLFLFFFKVKRGAYHSFIINTANKSYSILFYHISSLATAINFINIINDK